DASPFMSAYENFLLEHSIDYIKVSHFEGLKGKVLSSSYMPCENESTYESMLNALKGVFHKYNKNGFVEFVYKTEMYFGRL
ncbi:MAG: hypothetical protein ACM34N_15260, partial [Ignavibacteria bacterium]